MAEPEPRPLPLSDLLAELRSRGVAIGIREHYEVAWLLERWPDLSTLKEALGAILGTDREEARIVRETFDELYPDGWKDLDEVKRLLGPVLATSVEDEERVGAELEEVFGEEGAREGKGEDDEERAGSPVPAWRRFARAYWPGLFVVAAFLGLIAFLVRPEPTPELPPSDPAATETAPDGKPNTEPEIVEPPKPDPAVEEEIRPPEPDPVQLTGDLYDPPSVPRWSRGAVAGGVLGLAAFLWLYWVRTGREARRTGYRVLAERADSLADPQTYELDLSALEPPFDGGLLDDVAMLLSRQATVAEARREIDVDESVDRTLEAGLAPRLVFKKRTSVEPLLVLEDVAAEMKPYRLRTAALLAGLRERGVYFEHWRFDGDAERLFQDSGPSIGLERLVRERSVSPLLILSTGEGILRGDDFERAEWIGRLHYWLSRAWLHPNPDPTTWRQVVKELPLPVWPLSAEGLSAASRHLATGETDETTSELRLMHPPRPVTPLQVNRLRRLLDLSPQRTAGVGELLRQEFCPQVPSAAVVEALPAPPLEHPPAIGPSDEEVRAFLIELLDQSRPEEAGSAAEQRWRLDRAFQGIHVESEREESLETLRELGEGPLAAEVAAAVEPLAENDGAESLPDALRSSLGRRVLRPIGREAARQGREKEGSEGRRRWSWPTVFEVLVPLLLLGLITLATPYLGSFFNDPAEAVEPIEYAFEVSVSYPEGNQDSGPFKLEVSEIVPGALGKRLSPRVDDRPGRTLYTRPPRVFQGETEFGVFDFSVEGELPEEERGHWYWVGAQLESGVFGVSRPVWVGSALVGLLDVTFVDPDGNDLGAIGYQVSRDEEIVQGTAKEPLALARGEWTLLVDADGYLPLEQQVRVPSQQVLTLEGVPEAAPLPPPPDPGPAPAPPVGTLRLSFIGRSPTYYTVARDDDPKEVLRGSPDEELELGEGRWRLGIVDMGRLGGVEGLDEVFDISEGQLTSRTFEVYGSFGELILLREGESPPALEPQQTDDEQRLLPQDEVPADESLYEIEDPGPSEEDRRANESSRANPLILIEGGEFRMGSPEGVGEADERPQHRVQVSSFYMQQHEVTNEEYSLFDPEHAVPEGRERYPVVGVTWNEAQAYSEWLGGSLPTEEQWEFAARGTEGRLYPWGDARPTCERANYSDCGKRLKAVGSHPAGATPEGVEDLSGNVREWCRDLYGPYPSGPSSGSNRVLRSGSFNNRNPETLRSANRHNDDPGSRRDDHGFRVVWAAKGDQEAASAGDSSACSPRIEIDAPSCLPLGENAVLQAFADCLEGGGTVRLYFRRLNPVGGFYYVEMAGSGDRTFWSTFPRPEDRQQLQLTDEWWEVLQSRDWMEGRDRSWLEDFLENQEQEAVEYYVAVFDAAGSHLARSEVRLSTVQADDCFVGLTPSQRGWADNLAVGETTPLQPGKAVFHWLCDGIVTRIDSSGVLRRDEYCN